MHVLLAVECPEKEKTRYKKLGEMGVGAIKKHASMTLHIKNFESHLYLIVWNVLKLLIKLIFIAHKSSLLCPIFIQT